MAGTRPAHHNDLHTVQDLATVWRRVAQAAATDRVNPDLLQGAANASAAALKAISGRGVPGHAAVQLAQALVQTLAQVHWLHYVPQAEAMPAVGRAIFCAVDVLWQAGHAGIALPPGIWLAVAHSADRARVKQLALWEIVAQAGSAASAASWPLDDLVFIARAAHRHAPSRYAAPLRAAALERVRHQVHHPDAASCSMAGLVAALELASGRTAHHPADLLHILHVLEQRACQPSQVLTRSQAVAILQAAAHSEAPLPRSLAQCCVRVLLKEFSAAGSLQSPATRKWMLRALPLLAATGADGGGQLLSQAASALCGTAPELDDIDCAQLLWCIAVHTQASLHTQHAHHVAANCSPAVLQLLDAVLQRCVQLAAVYPSTPTFARPLVEAVVQQDAARNAAGTQAQSWTRNPHARPQRVRAWAGMRGQAGAIAWQACAALAPAWATGANRDDPSTLWSSGDAATTGQAAAGQTAQARPSNVGVAWEDDEQGSDLAAGSALASPLEHRLAAAGMVAGRVPSACADAWRGAHRLFLEDVSAPGRDTAVGNARRAWGSGQAASTAGWRLQGVHLPRAHTPLLRFAADAAQWFHAGHTKPSLRPRVAPDLFVDIGWPDEQVGIFVDPPARWQHGELVGQLHAQLGAASLQWLQGRAPGSLLSPWTPVLGSIWNPQGKFPAQRWAAALPPAFQTRHGMRELAERDAALGMSTPLSPALPGCPAQALQHAAAAVAQHPVPVPSSLQLEAFQHSTGSVATQPSWPARYAWPAFELRPEVMAHWRQVTAAGWYCIRVPAWLVGALQLSGGDAQCPSAVAQSLWQSWMQVLTTTQQP